MLFIIHGLIKRKTNQKILFSLVVYAYSLTLLNAVFSGQKLCLNRRGFKLQFHPFVSFFCRFKIHEDTDTSLDDLSDCSSDSMEVCCDDLGESF